MAAALVSNGGLYLRDAWVDQDRLPDGVLANGLRSGYLAFQHHLDHAWNEPLHRYSRAPFSLTIWATMIAGVLAGRRTSSCADTVRSDDSPTRGLDELVRGVQPRVVTGRRAPGCVRAKGERT